MATQATLATRGAYDGWMSRESRDEKFSLAVAGGYLVLAAGGLYMAFYGFSSWPVGVFGAVLLLATSVKVVTATRRTQKPWLIARYVGSGVLAALLLAAIIIVLFRRLV